MGAERSRRILVVAGVGAVVLTMVACAGDRAGAPSPAGPVQGRPDHGEWRKLPPAIGARAAGLSNLAAVRVGDRVVVVAGGSYRRAGRVEALVYDVRRRDHAVSPPARGGWSWAPSAPLNAPRGGMSVVAGRGEAIAWGGATNAVPALDGRGARYDPLRGHWRRVAPAPIAPRAFHSAVWTGSRMIVWGGTSSAYMPRRTRRLLADGAAYDPRRDRWRAIPAGPLRPRSGHLAVWTGSRMIVWGGEVAGRNRSAGPLARDGAAYDPVRRTWERIAAAPVRWMPNSQAFWIGDLMVIWTGRTVMTYRPATDRWEPNRWIRWPRSPLSNRMGSVAAWTGEELLVWGGPQGPCGDCAPKERSGRPRTPTDGAAFDPLTGSWRLLPPSPLTARDRHVAVGLGGGRAFVWGGCCRGSRQLADGALYRPGPLVPANVGRDLEATCGAIEAPRTAVRCPGWLPAPARRDGATAFHVGNRDIDGSACGYLTELHLRSAPPGAPPSAGRHPFHVWFGGRCEPFPIDADDGHWPPVPDRTSYLGLVGVAPETPGGPSRERLVRPRVVAVTSVRGHTALVLAVEPFPRGGLHGGHYAIVWNEGGDGYAISFHGVGGDRGLDPTPREIRILTRAAASMRVL
jgi:N-acetylneuraminic acid mutarotase